MRDVRDQQLFRHVHEHNPLEYMTRLADLVVAAILLAITSPLDAVMGLRRSRWRGDCPPE
jgi:hypothetical protein